MITRSQSRPGLLLALVLALPLAGLPLMVSAYGQDADAGEQAPAPEISDAEIEAFAAALIDVQEIGQAWTQRMQEAEDQEAIAEMREEARAEMTAAIEEHGLTVEEYNQIATAAQDDPELAQRIQQAAGGF